MICSSYDDDGDLYDISWQKLKVTIRWWVCSRVLLPVPNINL